MRPFTLPAADLLPDLALLSGLVLRLRARDVDLWRISLDDQADGIVEQLGGLLSEEEQARADGFHFERDCRRFVVGRGVLRVLLGRYLDVPPHEVLFTAGPQGKPALPEGDLQFNLTHSEGLAVLAFTRAGDIGVDLERVRDLPDWSAIAAACLPPRELQAVRQASPAARLPEFFRAWTRQEAQLKALGTGFLGDQAVETRERDLRLFALDVAPGYEAALAVTAEAQWVTCFSWENSKRSGWVRPVRRAPRVKLQPTVNAKVDFL